MERERNADITKIRIKGKTFTEKMKRSPDVRQKKQHMET
jgi:hypothetical protein